MALLAAAWGRTHSQTFSPGPRQAAEEAGSLQQMCPSQEGHCSAKVHTCMISIFFLQQNTRKLFRL